MAQYLSEVGQPVWIRHVLVPQRTDYDEFLIRLDAFIQTLNNVEKVEVLPYHTMGKFKWDKRIQTNQEFIIIGSLRN